MEANISEVKGLAKKVFGINGIFGKITGNGSPDSFLIWSKGFIPRKIAKVVPAYNRLILLNKRYEKKFGEFAEQYRLNFLSEGGYLQIIRDYD